MQTKVNLLIMVEANLLIMVEAKHLMEKVNGSLLMTQLEML